jgi:hypothetical protein
MPGYQGNYWELHRFPDKCFLFCRDKDDDKDEGDSCWEIR